jgi:chromosome segregation and condensation protein ScpB
MDKDKKEEAKKMLEIILFAYPSGLTIMDMTDYLDPEPNPEGPFRSRNKLVIAKLLHEMAMEGRVLIDFAMFSSGALGARIHPLRSRELTNMLREQLGLKPLEPLPQKRFEELSNLANESPFKHAFKELDEKLIPQLEKSMKEA